MNWEITETQVKASFAAVGALLSEVVGGLDTMLYVLLYMALADYITGVMVAYKQRSLNSRRAKEGVNSKIYMFVLVGAAHLVGENFLHLNHALRDAAIFWYCGKEFLSLLENGGKMGAPVPKFLKEAVTALNSDNQERRNN